MSIHLSDFNKCLSFDYPNDRLPEVSRMTSDVFFGILQDYQDACIIPEKIMETIKRTHVEVIKFLQLLYLIYSFSSCTLYISNSIIHLLPTIM